MKVKMVKTNNGFQIHTNEKVYFFRFSKELEDIYNIYLKNEIEVRHLVKIAPAKLRKRTAVKY